MLYREALDRARCGTPGCTKHAKPDPIVLHSLCHRKEPTWVVYAHGVLTVRCAKCDDIVVQIAVASVPGPKRAKKKSTRPGTIHVRQKM